MSHNTRSLHDDEDELFISHPGPQNIDQDAPAPLRINKPPSNPANATSTGPTAHHASRYQYPPPPTSSQMPNLGVSSSSNPMVLPYPDDNDDDDDEDEEEEEGVGTTFANPSFSPVSTTSSFNNHFPSPTESNKGPGLGERRGAVPKPLNSPPTTHINLVDIRYAQVHQNGGSMASSPASIHQPSQTNLSSSSTSPPPQQPSQQQQQQSSQQQPKPYYPPPGGSTGNKNYLQRFTSNASVSTTKASRGSPPPPETPIEPPHPGNQYQQQHQQQNQQRFPQPPTQYANAAPRPWTPTESPGHQPHGPPTVYQGSTIVSQQPSQNTASPPPQQASQPQQQSQPQTQGQPIQQPQPQQASSTKQAESTAVLEQDFQRLTTSTPPPAYSTVNPSAANSSSYPSEKGQTQQQQQPTQQHPATVGAGSPPPAHPGRASPAVTTISISSTSSSSTIPANFQSHPAFANDPKADPNAPNSAQTGPPNLNNAAANQIPGGGLGPQNQYLQAQQTPYQQQANYAMPIASPVPMSAAPTLTSPPPLPEGWIAHLDADSGQYYYIHLATQATQWEFPKGPNPLNHDMPLSPTSTYGNPLASPLFSGKQSMLSSPMFPPQTPGYAESVLSVAASAAPTMAYTGPPPSAGIDIFRVQPTNGVYFGPYLRYVNMDIERGVWYGSIMIITDAPQPPTIHIHLSVDLSPDPRQLNPKIITSHQRWNFYRYDVDLAMGEYGTDRWTYAVTSHMGCTRYEFVVAGRNENSWRFIAHSGNDFTASTSQAERSKLGGVGFMWKDVLQKNVDCNGFHVQLGLGGQMYGDRLWKEVPSLKQWLSMAGKENRKNANWTARHEEDVTHAYFHYYTSHFDQPYLREAFAQIPHILQLDDHDIFDGFGSYPDYMQTSHMFKNIGRIAIDMYLLFQHHTTPEMLRTANNDMDLFTITGQGWHFVKYLGPSLVVAGVDCRSERTKAHVLSGPTYQGIFPKIATLPPTVQHCIWMLAVPLVYPRLEAVESLAGAVATGKKAVNTTYNLLGKVTSSVAGVVGGKEVVAQGFSHVKKAVGKQGLMGNVLNQFGELDLAEELKDMWTHETKDLERTYVVRTLQGIAQQKGIRMTFFSGDVNVGGAGLLHDPSHPDDHKTMYQIITSPIVAQPQSNYLMKFLHNHKMLYVPQNGQKSTQEVSDTKEDMMEIFHQEVTGAPREYKKLMTRRNYVACLLFDQDAANNNAAQPHLLMSPQLGGGGAASMLNGLDPSAASVHSGGDGNSLAKYGLAVDFVVQGDGAFPGAAKYGPVVIPHLEFGR